MEEKNKFSELKIETAAGATIDTAKEAIFESRKVQVKEEKKAPQKVQSRESKKDRKADDSICENVNYATKEAFKRLRTNLLLSLSEYGSDKCSVIGVTSAQPSEGKSTVAVNTAYALAELEEKVLLIDADMRRPSIHTKLGLNLSPGLSNLLADSNSISGNVKKYENKSGNVSFDVITGGDVPGNPSEMLTSSRMEMLIDALSAAYRYIILDLPPVGAVTDAIAVGKKKTDGMIIVVRENKCPVNVFDDCIEQLRFAKINILGFVVNGSTEGASKGYKYGKYNY